jgi:ubiquinone/menaquinone biosynthesis C-methylase UbiE
MANCGYFLATVFREDSAMPDTSGFQLGGTAPENYDRFVTVFMAPFVDAIVQRANIKRGDSVLDVACGTGTVARAASTLVGDTGSVAGLDINPGMLEVAQRISSDADRRIEWHEASAESMPFEDARFDAVLSSQGIMFFPDLRQGLSEMCRVANHGGRVVTSFWAGPLERSPYIAASNKRLEPFVPEGIRLAEQAFRLDRDEIVSIIRELGLDEVTAETVEVMIPLPAIPDYFPGHVASLPYADDFDALDHAAKQRLYEDITSDLASYVQADGTVLVPFVVHMVAGTR